MRQRALCLQKKPLGEAKSWILLEKTSREVNRKVGACLKDRPPLPPVCGRRRRSGWTQAELAAVQGPVIGAQGQQRPGQQASCRPEQGGLWAWGDFPGVPGKVTLPGILTPLSLTL